MSVARPDLSVIVASYETRESSLACLAALARARSAHPELVSETIVVDNGSRDGSVEAIAAVGGGVRLLALARNRGFAAAINLGLRVARGRHVLLLNSDASIEPDVLARGVGLLDESTDVGVLGVALLHPDGRPQRSAHPLPGLATELLPEAWLRLLRPCAVASASPGRPAAVDGGRLVEVEAVRGAVFFVRGELLEKLGPLDESYFFFLEETDYCRRVRAAGYRVGLCTDLRAIHGLGISSKRRSPLATRIEYHRSLYRYLSRQSGKAVALLAAALRTLRTLAVLPGLAVAACFSLRSKARLAERAGLALWHLRGCPREPDFATAIAASVSRGRASVDVGELAQAFETGEEG
ncbi:MAG: glycosyltransferase family 2 protein [Deltaproteobacteria bacterium]|jgi:GT2 family glycosyltransferase|nr:glycosyltransferase family 2 protein [Deltaproteobacteria bacterium]MBW2499235.1 glycosyltransferase family 2 protein [Deltaproteobacteria bacterium]